MKQFVRRWWPVGLGAVLGLAVGLTLVVTTPKSYTATSTLFLGSPVSSDSIGALHGDAFSQQRAKTYPEVVKDHDLAVKVIDDLSLSISPAELSEKVTAGQIPKTVLVWLSVTDTSATRAAEIANDYASVFAQYIARLETPLGSNRPVLSLTVTQKAEVPTSPTSPNIPLNIVIGLVGGIIIGFFGKWLMRIRDRRVRTSKQVGESVGAPVLGVLPKDAARRSRRLNLATEGEAAYADAVRKLRTNLLYANVDEPPVTIAFISPTSTVSTTATATNSAVLLDAMGRQVALIDADIRESRLARYIGKDSYCGLTSAITGDVSVDDVLVRVPDTGVDVIVAGPRSNTASEVLASDSLAKLFAELRSRYDFVFCDTPGFLTAADAAVIGLGCDGIVLVASQGKTRIEDLSETAAALRSLGGKVIGAVLTDA